MGFVKSSLALQIEEIHLARFITPDGPEIRLVLRCVNGGQYCAAVEKIVKDESPLRVDGHEAVHFEK